MTVHQLLPPTTTPPPGAVRLDACAYVEPDVMFPDETLPNDHPDVAAAKAVCAGCPVRDACRADVLGRWEAYGVWGGLTFKEREAIRKQEARAAARRARQGHVVPAAASARPAESWGDQLDLLGVIA